MSLRMINDYVLIALIDNTRVTSGGLLLTTVEPPCTGTVLSVGPGRFLDNGEREEHNLHVGDVVVFGKSSLNTPIEEDNVKYYVMKIGDIFGKKND
ncbi:putative co-chaperonin GroES [Erwinia phage pEa_SNUABM_12]|uniref:Putative co-chaperonin GroES n=1 Tax=Erwinia phage pEa_SNUABM_12 TaxID=2768773 RepID=A0A7L8ZLC9_9CAUD|nr:putative co-chaperonin GroES [Erwinia phage pEa_SNUABM_12]